MTEEIVIAGDNVAETGCSAGRACDPSSRLHRYLMLFFICFLSFGSYFCYDNPAALQDVMLRSLEMTEIEFMNLYSFYSWPNVVLSFVGGYLIDRYLGIPLGAITFSIFVLLGQLILGIGSYFSSIPTMYFARLVFGIGGESLAVAQNAYTIRWFPPSEVNFIFGLQLSISRVGSTVNMVTMQKLNDALGKAFGIIGSKQLGASLLIASLFCLFSTFCAVVLAYFTKRADRILDPRKRKSSETVQNLIDNEVNSDPDEEKISLRAILEFPAAIWLICIICVAYYVTVFPFVSLGLVFFIRKFGLTVETASIVNSLVYILSAVASPVFGAAIDFTGCNLYWILTSILLTLFCHMCFAFTTGGIPAMLIVIIMGIAYSILASSLWPLVAFLLPVKHCGTAYGIIQSIQNLGLGLVSLFVGYLVDNKGYLFLEVFFTFCLSLAIASTFGLFMWDKMRGGRLNETGRKRRSRVLRKPIAEPYEPINI